MNNKRYLIIFLFLFLKSFCQTDKIYELKKNYQFKIEQLQNKCKAELKKLPVENYNKNKQLVVKKYNTQIDKLILEREKQIAVYQAETHKIEREKLEMQKKIDEKNQVYQAEPHKIESGKMEMQKKFDEKTRIARRKQDSINEANVIYNSYGLDVKPKFNKNSDDFVKYIKSKLTTEDTNILDGKFLAASFIVEKNGILTDIKIIKGVNTEIDDKILKIIRESPEWESGLQNGKKVRSSFQISIRFKKNEY